MKSMRTLARNLQGDDATFRRAVHKNLRQKSYMRMRGQFLSERIRENRFTRAKHLLNKLKHSTEKGILWFSPIRKYLSSPRR